MTESPSLPLLLRRWNLKRELKMLMKSLFLDLSSKFLEKTTGYSQPLQFFYQFWSQIFVQFLNLLAKGRNLFEKFSWIIPKRLLKKDWESHFEGSEFFPVLSRKDFFKCTQKEGPRSKFKFSDSMSLRAFAS